MTAPRATIVAASLLSPLGLTLDDTARAILAGRFITTHSRCPIDLPPGASRVLELATAASRQVLAQAGWNQGLIQSDRTALIVGTSKGPIESWISDANALLSLSDVKRAFTSDLNASPDPAGWTYGLAQTATHLAQRLRLGQGPRETLSAACASSLDALIRAAMMIEMGQIDRAVVVGCESSLHPIFLSSFQRLGVLPRPEVGCRPFDQSRDGFLMSESAAAICLVRSDQAGISKGVQVNRYHIAGDATHLTSADPQGKTMIHVLRSAWGNGQVDLVHAHGTGTPSHDPVELSAIEWVAREIQTHRPVVFSHKGSLGHSLGAAGLVSTALSFWMHQHQTTLPNVRTTQPIAHDAVTLSTNSIHTRIDRSVILAAGFGGATAAVGLQSI